MEAKARTSTQILALNLEACMKAPKSPAKSQLALAKKSGIAQATIGRILRCESHASLDTVDAIAHVYGHAGWQMILPDFDCMNPQVIKQLTSEEKSLYERLKIAAQDLVKYETK